MYFGELKEKNKDHGGYHMYSSAHQLGGYRAISMVLNELAKDGTIDIIERYRLEAYLSDRWDAFNEYGLGIEGELTTRPEELLKNYNELKEEYVKIRNAIDKNRELDGINNLKLTIDDEIAIKNRISIIKDEYEQLTDIQLL